MRMGVWCSRMAVCDGSGFCVEESFGGENCGIVAWNCLFVAESLNLTFLPLKPLPLFSIGSRSLLRSPTLALDSSAPPDIWERPLPLRLLLPLLAPWPFVA